MAHSDYPVIERRVLAAPEKRFLRSQYRATKDLPVAQGHHRLVYRVNGDYILDNAALKGGDDLLLAADHVSVVDVSADVEVRVHLTIRSAEDSELTVEVAFTCSVSDPVTVVRNGLNAARVLTAYLEGHHRFYELALGFQDKDINEIRRHVNAQVKAFTTVQPPRFAGLEAVMASVQVHTPQEWADWASRRRSLNYEDTLQSEKAERDHVQKTEQKTREHALEVQQTEYEYGMQYDRQRQEQLIEAKQRAHEQDLNARKQEYLRDQMRRDAQEIGTNPILALGMALQAGAITYVEYSEAVQRLRDRAEDRELEARRDALDWARQEARLNREEDKEGRAWEREKERLGLEDNRQDRQWTQEGRAWEREKERLGLEDNRQDRQWTHEERMKALEAEYESKREALAREREQELRRLEIEREQTGQRFTVEREDARFDREVRLAELQSERAKELLKEQESHEDQRRREQEARDDQLRREQQKREDDVRDAELRKQVVSTLLQRGQFDTQHVDIDVERLVGPLGAGHNGAVTQVAEHEENQRPPQAQASQAAEIPQVEAPQAEPREDD
jgi:hypothetical protein